MTPAARVQTAIECLDRIARGEAAEKVLTSWARASRHAGSKDRAAVRDHVFDALRRWWSSVALGGGESGRHRMIGTLKGQGIAPESLFTGAGYGPAPLGPEETPDPPKMPLWQACDCPEWLEPDLRASLGADFAAVMEALQHRAPVFLRVNSARGHRDAALAALAREGIAVRPHPLSPTALEVIGNARRIHQSEAYRSGLVEMQDAASQAVVDLLPLGRARRILDYCAGGGGKTLAVAARTDATIHAHDANVERMRDLPERAARAGVTIDLLNPGEPARQTPYDLILVDAPCSGSGAWRRSPEGKIRLSRADLDRVLSLQQSILSEASRCVGPGGILAYITCSLLDAENADQVTAFLRDHPEYSRMTDRRWTPLDGGDGFYCALLQHGSP